MGQRLNIEITDGTYVLASCSYIDTAYSEEALDLAESITRSYDTVFGGNGCDLYVAVSLLEMTGGGVTGMERQRILKDETGRFDGMRFDSATSASAGFLCVTERGIEENRRWESGRVLIDLKRSCVDFHVHYYTYMEEYIEFAETVPGCVPWDELPRLNADADSFTGIYFDHIQMVRKIIEQCPLGFRLNSGDVIEWM